jgi:hypothetical protein
LSHQKLNTIEFQFFWCWWRLWQNFIFAERIVKCIKDFGLLLTITSVVLLYIFLRLSLSLCLSLSLSFIHSLSLSLSLVCLRNLTY